jgi:hypothetical protein
VEADLQSFVQQCDQLMNTLHTVIDTTSDLLQQHATTTQKTREIHGRCNTLLTSKDKLDDVVQQIVQPLSYFNCLDDLCARVGLPPETTRFGSDEVPYDATPLDLQSLAPDSPGIFDVLDQTAECLQYLKTHPSFRDSADYATGFLMVEKRALLLIKNDVFAKLEHETTKILEHMEKIKMETQTNTDNSNMSSSPLLMDGSDHIELLPPYTWWGTIGDMLRGQLGEITRRARAGRTIDAVTSTSDGNGSGEGSGGGSSGASQSGKDGKKDTGKYNDNGEYDEQTRRCFVQLFNFTISFSSSSFSSFSSCPQSLLLCHLR